MATLLAAVGLLVVNVPMPTVASASPAASSPATAAATSPAAPVPQSAYSNSSVASNGLRKTEISDTPINYKDAQGAWQPINDSLVATARGGWHNQADSSSVQLPADLSSPVSLSKESSSIGFTLVGANHATANAGSVSGSAATYLDALAEITVTERAVPSGVKETLTLASAAASNSITWNLSLSSGLRAEPVSGGGIAINGANGGVAQIAAPSVKDAAGNIGSASLALDAAGTSLTLTIDPTWLATPGRLFPVTVDPTTQYLSQADGCTISSGSPTTASCASTDIGVGVSGGNVQRGLVHFGYLNTDLPVDAQVVNAYLDLPVASLSGSVTLNAYPLTRAYSNSAVTWNDYDGTHAWTTAGGDYASTPTVSGSVPSSGDFYLNVPTATTQAWVDGAQANDGFLLKASNESSGTNLADFDPSNGYGDFLDVFWTPNTGDVSGYPIISHTLDDHLSLGVNAADGNLIVHATDLSIQGAAGQNEVMDRYYNSENLATYGGLGDSWNFGEGSGVFLDVNSDNVTAFLPSGQVAVFLDNGSAFTTPPGVDAVLSEPSSGDYTLIFNSSQEKISFQAQSCSSWAIPETSVADRNGETISYGYSSTTCDPSGIPMLTSVTDTEGRVTTVSDNGYYYTGLTDPQTPTARTASYSVSGTPTLTSTKDTSGNYTYYTYQSGTALLTQIEDPNGNYTEIAYNAAGQVHTVTYVTNVSAKTGPTYTYTYTAGTTSLPDSGSTTVQDPNGNTTTYDYKHSDLQTMVTDANSHSHQTMYSPDNQPSTLTDSLSAGSTINYDSGNNSISTLEPANGSDTAAESYTNYQMASSSGTSGYQYLPSSGVDAQGNCSMYGYDANGNLTNTYAGATNSSGMGESGDPGCTTSTSSYATHTTTKYDGDPSVSCTNAKTGEVCSTIDGDGNTTSYAYDTSGDLASVTPPSPQGATTYTYDSLSRVATVTNGDGNSGTPGTISTVQSATTNYGSSPVSSQTTTLPANTTKGDTVVVTVGAAPVTPVVSVSSISGGGVGTWHLGKASSTTALGDEEIWYGTVTTGGSSSVTVNMSASTTEIGTVVAELTGVASSSPLDVSGSNSGSSTTVNTPSLTTTAAGDIVIDAGDADNTISSSPSSPWADYAGPLYFGSAYTPATTRVTGAAGAYSTSWGASPSGGWLSVGIALKPAVETTAYTYDAMDRVTQILYGGDAACIPSSGNCITYTYDADGNVTQRVDNTGTYTFTYDALNRLTDKGTPSGADACSGSSPSGITYAYDGASNLTTSCDALGTTNYYYDAGNRLMSQVEPGGTAGCAVPSTTEPGCTAYSYDADNQLLVSLFPGGAKQTSQWTTNNKMKSIVGTNSSGTPQTSFVYSYASGTNDQDLVQTRVENDPSVSSATTVTYGYNLNNELISAVTTGGSSSTLTYYYDAAGNRCSAAPTTLTVCPSGTNYYAYNSAEAITTGPTGSYTSDGAGNLTSSPALSNLTYNSKNQTSSITPAGGSAIGFAYANTGQAERTSAGSVTFTSGNWGVDRSVAGTTTTYFIRNNVGTVIGEHVGTTSYYYLTDNEGSINAVMTSTGSVQNRYAYDPYGQVTSSSGSVSNPYGYAGGYTDSLTGLIKFGTRYYSPVNGYFTQPDPGSGSYLYADDDPANSIDPSGLAAVSGSVEVCFIVCAKVSVTFGSAGTSASASVGAGPEVGASFQPSFSPTSSGVENGFFGALSCTFIDPVGGTAGYSTRGPLLAFGVGAQDGCAAEAGYSSGFNY